MIASLLALTATLEAQYTPLPPTRTGHLYVTGSASNNVVEFHADGTPLRSFAPAGLMNPRGIAVDDLGDLVVVTETNSRICLLDLAGNVVRTVTHPDLTSGTGIARAPDGSWHVGNFSPGRIVVFDQNWNHVATRTAPGMAGVNCVAFERDGRFAVTAAVANAVFRFAADGSLLGTTSHAQMGSPMSIAIDSAGNHFVSNGGTGVILKFDPAWSPLLVFGAGTLALPQGIAIDERDRLTITNFASPTVHRYGAAGSLLGSFPATGLQTARNLAFQTAAYVLARHGSVDAGRGPAAVVLSVNGLAGDAMGRLQSGRTSPLVLALAGPPAGPAPAPFVLYAHLGEPGPGQVEALPFGAGLMAFPTPLGGSTPLVLVNSLGSTTVLGAGLLPPASAPATLLSLPQGLGFALQVTIQGAMLDFGAAGVLPLSSTNAVALTVQ
jgi:DNA-binding beta-propeller fold protein YncE